MRPLKRRWAGRERKERKKNFLVRGVEVNFLVRGKEKGGDRRDNKNSGS